MHNTPKLPDCLCILFLFHTLPISDLWRDFSGKFSPTRSSFKIYPQFPWQKSMHFSRFLRKRSIFKTGSYLRYTKIPASVNLVCIAWLLLTLPKWFEQVNGTPPTRCKKHDFYNLEQALRCCIILIRLRMRLRLRFLLRLRNSNIDTFGCGSGSSSSQRNDAGPCDYGGSDSAILLWSIKTIINLV
jgi:hypothetical protein